MEPLLFLKNGSYAPAPGLPVLKKNDYALLLQAEQVLDHARAEAENIRAEAQKMYAAEKERGYADGMDTIRMEMTDRIMDTVASGIDYLENIEGSVVELVMQSLRKVIEGLDDKERVIGVVRKALSYARNQKKVLLRLCPEDEEYAQAEVARLTRDHPGIGILDIIADPRLAKGACLLESELGVIDAGLEVQLAAIGKSFERQLKKGTGKS
jgi:type III secretion protein L